MQRTVAFAPIKNVTARMRFRKKALKKYKPTTLQRGRTKTDQGKFLIIFSQKVL